LEADLTERFTAGIAIRYEDFESFGDTTNYKVSGRFAVTDALAFRGSFSTGFRAPTPGQENVTKVSTVTIDGELQQRGQIPPTNPIAQTLGALPLIPEDATNASVGIVWDITDSFSLTADYYNINVENRISQTGTIDISDEPAPPGADCPITQGRLDGGNLAQCLQELGVPGAGDLASVSFYTNDFETTTNGFDLVGTWNTDFGSAGNGTLVAAWNWTETEVDSAGSEVDRNKVVNLENYNSRNRGVFTYNHFIGNFRFLARARYYDDWIEGDWSDDPTDRGPNGNNVTIDCGAGLYRDNCYSGTTLFDLEAAYTFADKYSFIVGAQNVGDDNGPVDIDNLDGTVGSGNTYTDSTPWGYEGGFYYVRFRAEFE
jgi:iron complex outermembrane receptor protein